MFIYNNILFKVKLYQIVFKGIFRSWNMMELHNCRSVFFLYNYFNLLVNECSIVPPIACKLKCLYSPCIVTRKQVMSADSNAKHASKYVMLS